MMLKIKLRQTNNYQKNYKRELLENLEKEKYIHLLKKILRVLI